MKRHPSWQALLARPLDAKTAAHVQECPQCRVDRRRLLAEAPLALPRSPRARLDEAHEPVRCELLPAVRSAVAKLPRISERTRLPAAGTAFGPYRAVGVIGRGETSVVLLGVHERHGTRHALKVVRTRRPEVMRQVHNEHRLQDELSHPQLLPVVDSLDAATGQAVLVLEFVDGPSLAKLLRARAFLPWPWIDAIAIDVLGGIAALHEAGWVHRDLNPGNVLIDPNPAFRARLGDFGQTARRGTTDPNPPSRAMPLYAAPEHLAGASPTDPRGDVFALGSLLYELVTHQRCFAGLDGADVARRVREGEHLPVAQLRPDAPARIIEAIDAALTLDPEDRPAQASELLDLWTRGAGEAARPVVDLTGVERASLRSMRGIERLPEAKSTLTPTSVPEPTGTFPALTQAQVEARTYARPKLPRVLRGGRWAALFGGLGLAGIIGAATWSSMQAVPEPAPTEIRLDRGWTGVIDPSLSQNRGRLVFSDQRDLWVGPLDGSKPRSVTEAFEPSATQPVWSQQSAIAFTSAQGIYTVDLRSGEAPIPVVPWGRDPTWSPDGSRIVFVARAHDDQPVALRVWDRWTQQIVTLLEEPDLARPTFSPDGRRLALQSGNGLELLDVTVGDEGRLAVTGREPIAPFDTAPRWTNDTTLVVFRAHGGERSGGSFVRWEEANDRWTDTQILETTHNVRSFEVGRNERWFVLGLTDPVLTVLRIPRSGVVAPVRAGRQVRAGLDGGVVLREANGTLVRLDARGEPLSSIANPDLQIEDFGLHPDGTLVVKAAFAEGTPDWSVVGEDGVPNAHPTLSGAPLEGPFAWSEDGRFFAAHLNDEGPIVVDLDEPLGDQLDAVREAPWPGERVAALSPDGSWLVVTEDSAFQLVDRLSGEVVGEPLRGLALAFLDDNTFAILQSDEIVLVDRETRAIAERLSLHPFTLPARPSFAVTAEALYVDGIVERGGLVRIDRLTAGQDPGSTPP
ncbi:MAG: protein kinase [Myxococcota bacterium]